MEDGSKFHLVNWSKVCFSSSIWRFGN